jgi:hypothetical protein
MPDTADGGRLADSPAHRAPEGEGARAPFVTEKGEPIQQSIFDGSGNEIIVVTIETEEGRRQGTGATYEEALKNARASKEIIGEGFFPPPK